MRLIDPDTTIQKEGLLPVTTYMIHEPSTNKFHPDGLFSEVIFGSIGSSERLVRFGYIDLRTTVIQPHIYTNLLKLNSMYNSVLTSKSYCVFNKKTKNLELADAETPGAFTGFRKFCEYIHQIDFLSTGSLIRDDRISVLDRYRDKILMNKMLVMPAGIRDVREDESGRLSLEDVNKLYLSLISLTSASPEDTSASDDPVFDPIRVNIQSKVMEIYEYCMEIISGKSGYAQGKFASRNIALGIVTGKQIGRAHV